MRLFYVRTKQKPQRAIPLQIATYRSGNAPVAVEIKNEKLKMKSSLAGSVPHMGRPACWQTGDTPVPAEIGNGRGGDAPLPQPRRGLSLLKFRIYGKALKGRHNLA